MSTNNKTLARVQSTFVAALMTLVAGIAAAQDAAEDTSVVGQDVLTVSNVPGNMVLVPSVEFPTLDSVANLGAYSVSRTYTGYFDSFKCYTYVYSATETDRYFNPSRTTGTKTCTQANKEWSGNYLNWAATQTIDPFRKALTGGYRVKDTNTETWLEKARSDGNGRGNYFPDRRMPASGDNSTLVSGATPTTWNSFNIRIGALGNQMLFSRGGNLSGGDGEDNGGAPDVPVDYDPAEHTTLFGNTVYRVSIRVKVCDTGLGVSALESNCVRYGSNYKPEGLIQKYSKRMRYSVFGYLNDGSANRDGGVLRARQKFVGAQQLNPDNGTWANNANKEWDPSTGILVKNPDSADAAATNLGAGDRSIRDSGVINYINKFGQMTTQNHKSHDPVSELFYAAVRYLKNQGNVSSYTALTGSNETNFNYADGFPVITNWDDPMQYRCQSNAFLGIGDIYTHVDKNLPGSTIRTREPDVPAEVSSDGTVNVMTRARQIAAMEGITISETGAFSGRDNSAYIAALAYDAHTVDLRPGLPDKQTASTYWVDVRESQRLETRHTNQYWLAAKYGGFTIPQNGFNPDTNGNTPLPSSWWSSDETLENNDPRPENFYVASEADKMVSSLRRAFASIAEDRGSASSLGANATRIDTTTRVYQAQYFGNTWRGELQSYTINQANGDLVTSWAASTMMGEWASRPIYVNTPGGMTEFEWDNLSSEQKSALESEDIVNYLRGERDNEESYENGTLRTRAGNGMLGDIVNSTPVYVGKPNPALYATASFTGATAYAAYASAKATRTPVVYVGANDGMLHGFNADTGAETFAFVPAASIANGLKEYSDSLYQHRYFVDGEMAIADVYDTSTTPGAWKTILVGTMGRGGPGVFALDVTNPASVQFLWEKTAADIEDLGRNIGRPVIAQVANGEWKVIFGNGPDNANDTAKMVTIGALTGAVAVADTPVTDAPNGLTAVLARDTNADGFADTAYAGDLQGNMWKFTGLSGTTLAEGRKIFQAIHETDGAQPITAAPLVGKDPNTGSTWVFFGTGRYLNKLDLEDLKTQSWYGIKDEYPSVTTRSDLVQRSILTEVRPTPPQLAVRTVDAGTAGELSGQRGWYMDLVSPLLSDGRTEGERMVVPNRFQGSALIGTTRIPDNSDLCNPSGTGFIMAVNPFTGARLESTFFDRNRDGIFNDGDLSGGDIVSGIGFGVGPNQPNFIENEMYVSLDDGTTEHLKVQGGGSNAGRMSWRELLN